MSQVIDLCKAELNKDYIVHKIKNNNKVYENYGIFENAPIVPLYRSMGKNISAYKLITVSLLLEMKLLKT